MPLLALIPVFSLLISSCAQKEQIPVSPIKSPPVIKVRDVKRAQAKIIAKSKSKIKGTVKFEEKDGRMLVTYSVSGLKPYSVHGFHIHENGNCSGPRAANAGDHYNPTYHPHGSLTGAQRHAGDMGNISANGKGIAQGELLVESLALNGDYNIVGRSVVIHADPDDMKSQPSGNSGARIGCGLIRTR